ncbi:glycerophosphoryl diester phosphodiesterase membrane domain-containing protein [Croceicoccus hydrothermalis]|uniref:glycerophosphoryl diester phosphodiesterase membrane domain-containing protein n=1 Tax=Croceicoccus hydrothermalis TaxID=2867964 RepID=UPI001EFB9A58|nr:hypothetical protein [Croceicoccus hydrothermalis]
MAYPSLKPAPKGPPPAKLDIGRAWSRAAAMIAANRQLLLIVAGVFFLLPQLIVNFVLPSPQEGLEGDAATQAMLDLFAGWWPVLLASLLIQSMGVLAVIALLADPARPTVGDAMKQALRYLPSYIAAQLVLFSGIGVIMLLVLVPVATAGAAAGSASSAGAFGTLIALAIALYLFVRAVLTAPVMVAQRVRNPFDALLRAWRLTRGNATRLLFFLALLTLSALIIYTVATLIPGLILLPLVGAGGAAVVTGFIGALVGALYSLITTAVLTAIWAQLAATPAK